jgi:hypothetical protein
MLDASPIPSPAGISSIPTGVYTMPFGIPQEQLKSCLTNSNQYNTWTCNTPQQPVILKVGSPPSQYQFLQMEPNITAKTPSNSSGMPSYTFNYGAQYPHVDPPQRLFWVQDIEEPSRGPALHFQTIYDKLVILEDDQFSPSKAKGKREADESTYTDANDVVNRGDSSEPTYTLEPSYVTLAATTSSAAAAAAAASTGALPDEPPGGYHHKKNQVSVGEQPWFCWWNQTWIEGFIYVESESSSSNNNKQKRHEGSSPTTTAPPVYPEGYSTQEVRPGDANYKQAQEVYLDAMTQHAKRMLSPPPSAATNADTNYMPYSTPSPKCFPYVMKIQERRIPCEQTIQPYCQRMYIPAEGPPVPVLNSDGTPVVVEIEEDSASFKDQQSGLKASASGGKDKRDPQQPRQLSQLMRRDDVQNSCHCLWVSSPLPS